MSTPMTSFVDGHWGDHVNGWTDTLDLATLRQDGDTWATYILTDQASLCGCVDETPIMAAMIAYLATLRHDDGDLGQVLIANMADVAGFTEHGTSLRFPWLTDAGRRWLELAGVVSS